MKIKELSATLSAFVTITIEAYRANENGCYEKTANISLNNKDVEKICSDHLDYTVDELFVIGKNHLHVIAYKR